MALRSEKYLASAHVSWLAASPIPTILSSLVRQDQRHPPRPRPPSPLSPQPPLSPVLVVLGEGFGPGVAAGDVKEGHKGHIEGPESLRHAVREERHSYHRPCTT